MDCKSLLGLSLLFLLLFPSPYFFPFTLAYVWPKVEAALHKRHTPYRPLSGQSGSKVILTRLLLLLLCWVSPSLGLHSIRLFAQLHTKLPLQNELTTKQIPYKKHQPEHCPSGRSSTQPLRARLLLPAFAGAQVPPQSCQPWNRKPRRAQGAACSRLSGGGYTTGGGSYR